MVYHIIAANPYEPSWLATPYLPLISVMVILITVLAITLCRKGH